MVAVESTEIPIPNLKKNTNETNLTPTDFIDRTRRAWVMA